MQIHELNNFNGTPGSTNYLAIDNGSDTARISGTDLLAPVNARIDNVVLQNKSESVNLFAGSISVGGGTYSLSESAANFDFLEFVFNFNGATVQTARVRPNADILISVPGFNATNSPSEVDITRLSVSINGANFTVAQAYNWSWNGESSANSYTTPAWAWANSLAIEVYGIRYAQLDSTEVTDLRTAHNGTVYPTARAAREADYNALDSKIADNTNKISSVKIDIANSNDGLEEIGLRYPFVQGGLINGALNTGFKYRVSTDSLISFDRDVDLIIANGYRFDIFFFVNGSYSVHTGWLTGSKKVLAGETFKLMIGRVTEDTSELADVETFVKQVTFISNLGNRVATLEADNTKNKADISDLEDIVIQKSINLYNPSLQTPETISPHYYANGVPYPTTQFDTAYNCTALIPIDGGKTYTIGLVPTVSGYVKPWAGAAFGVFFYDANETYLSQTADNTFTTPATAAYIRFNYYIGQGFHVTLDKLNSNCMLVEGSVLPSTFVAYYDTNLKERVETLENSSSEKRPLWYRRTGNRIEVGYPYDNNNNVVVLFEKYGGNNLFDLRSVALVSRAEPLASGARTSLMSSPSDCFGPYVVGAVNNIDGDDTSNMTFTGGNHQYNNTGSGSTPTARTISLNFYADNKAIADGEEGFCYEFLASWENRVQGYNTKKSDGSGREILSVKHTAFFNGDDIKVSTNIYPLEAVKMYTFYGYQSFVYTNMYPKVRYYDSNNRQLNIVTSGSSSSNSGDLIGYILHAEDSNNKNYMEVSINPQMDLGRRERATGFPAMFVSGNKSYFSIIRNVTDMASGSLYRLEGAYKFAAVL